MRIQHNIMAMNAYRNYNTNTSALSKNLEKLSSGYKINRAGDDAAGLAISEKMRAQITGLNAAQKNVKDGISLVKTAEGAMQEIQDMLNRMDYLATQSANGTYDDPVDRLNLQKEVNQLRSEINRIADSANFNGIKLLDGSLATSNAAAWNVEAETFTGADSNPQWAKEDISSKFGSTTADNAWHPGTGNGSQTTVSFKIDLNGMKATVSGTAGQTQSFKLNIAGQDVTFTVTAAAGDNAVTGSGFANAFRATNGSVSIQGVTFNVTGSGSELIFTADMTKEYTSDAAKDINDNWSKEITLSKGTAGNVSGATVTDEKAVRHTAYDYVEAKAADDAGRAGIDLDLTGLVTDYSKLTIKGTSADGSGDVTFVFKTDKNSAATADSAKNEILIDVSDSKFATTAAKEAEALRQMTNATVNTELNDPKATGKEVYLSAHGGKLHLDQTKTSTAVYGTPKSMQDLVIFQRGSDSAPTVGGASVDMNQFQLGDRVKVGNDTYVVAEATDADTGDITAEDLVAKLKDQITKDVDTSKYAVTVSGTEVKVTALTHGDGDTDAELAELKKTLETNVKELKEANAGGGGLTLQIGDTSDSFNQLKVNVGNMHVFAMGTFETQTVDGKEVQVLQKSIADIDISNIKGAQEAVDVIKNAINYVSSVRGDLGATQNRLEHTANNLSVMAENIQDAESTIRDTDVAEEMMAYTKNNILVQSAQAMLAQANAVPQGVLQLLG
nr:flagellin [uncultured Oscillibacter sp.]